MAPHDSISSLLPVKGIELGVASADVKGSGDASARNDIAIITFGETANCAGVFTQNHFCAAPVQLCRQRLQGEKNIRAWLINSGNANAGTGEQGFLDAEATSAALAQELGVDADAVLPFSTGVIGELLPVERMINALPTAKSDLSADHWALAANAIMTTDTRPKGISETLTIDGKTVTITGIAKGSGMIHPNMATMLSFVATDAAIDTALLQTLLTQATNQSFNRITVDGDTSTNDACMLVATGASQVVISENHSESLQQFTEALDRVMQFLAEAIVYDGEGANKFLDIHVNSAATKIDALTIAQSIALSPLVKTAFYAEDANWGRLLSAIGKVPLAHLNVDNIDIYLNDVQIVQQGARAQGYTEEKGAEVMKQPRILVRVELNTGRASDYVWTTDLSHEYVSINADYRT